MAAIQKQITIKLFLNKANMTFYVQLGGVLYPVRDKIAVTIQEKEGLEIRHARDLKDIQLMSLEDDKK